MGQDIRELQVRSRTAGELAHFDQAIEGRTRFTARQLGFCNPGVHVGPRLHCSRANMPNPVPVK